MPIAQGAQKKKKKKKNIYIYTYISRYNTNICNLFTKKKTHFTGVGLKKKDPLSYRSNKLPRCTVPKVIDFLRYNMKCSAGKTWYYAEYFMWYHVFLYISCYIAKIWITFRTGWLWWCWLWHGRCSRDGGAGGCYPPRRSSGRGCGQTWRTWLCRDQPGTRSSSDCPGRHPVGSRIVHTLVYANCRISIHLVGSGSYPILCSILYSVYFCRTQWLFFQSSKATVLSVFVQGTFIIYETLSKHS